MKENGLIKNDLIMARYKNGINGPVRGKVGNVVASNWRGVDYLKSLGGPAVKRRSEAQLLQQEIFALVTCWLRPVRELIWLGYQSFKANKTPMNAAISHVIKEAVLIVDGQPKIDFSKVIISRGELLISWVVEVVALTDQIIDIKWENPAGSSLCKPGDKANFLLYSPDRSEFAVYQNQAQRSDQEVRLNLSPGFSGNVVHIYMFYVNEEGDAVGTSQYLGELTVFI